MPDRLLENALTTATTTRKGVVQLATDGEVNAAEAVAANDSRLSNARTPTAHGHPSTDVTDFAEAVDDRVGALLLDSATIDALYDDAGNTEKLETIYTKAPVMAASTANVNVAAPGATIDGVALTAGDRVLLKDQTAGAENGLYLWNGAAVAMTRSPDADTSAEFPAGVVVYVRGGTANGAKSFIHTTAGAITLGTTALTFAQLGGSGGGSSGALTRIIETILTVAGATISLASIPSTYRHLRLEIVARTTAAVTEAWIYVRFNGDTASNYRYLWRRIYTSGATTVADDGQTAESSTVMWLGGMSGANSPAGAVGITVIDIGDYARAVWWKQCHGRSAFVGATTGAGHSQELTTMGVWKNTAAITSIDISASSGNFDIGTVVSLYGVS